MTPLASDPMIRVNTDILFPTDNLSTQNSPTSIIAYTVSISLQVAALMVSVVAVFTIVRSSTVKIQAAFEQSIEWKENYTRN